MKNTLFLFAICSFLCFAFSCDADDATNTNCEQLLTAMNNNDSLLLNTFNEMASDLQPQAASTDDPYGQTANFQTLIERVEQCSGFSAILDCYACMESFPPQSQFTITFEGNGQNFQKICHIRTSQSEPLTYFSMH